MTENATTELRVGPAWCFQCRFCEHEVSMDGPYPDRCPGCQAGGWWPHVAISNKVSCHGHQNQPLNDGGQGNVPARIVAQQNQRYTVSYGDNNADSEAPAGRRGRGHPVLVSVPTTLIKDMGQQGYSSRMIAEALADHGQPVSYKTVQRVLRGTWKGA